MKLFLFLFVVAAVGAHSVQLSQEQKDKVRQYSAECVKETGVKPELVAQAKKGHFIEDEALKKFTLCFFAKSGLISEDGHLNTEVAIAKFPAGVDKKAVLKVLEECNKKKGRDVADTAFEMFKCYYHATPTHAVF